MTEMTTGKMLFVLAIVLGCFAVLWPKIFYPMMFEASNRSSKTGNNGPTNEDFILILNPHFSLVLTITFFSNLL